MPRLWVPELETRLKEMAMVLIMIACMCALATLALIGLAARLPIRWTPGLGWTASSEVDGWSGLE